MAKQQQKTVTDDDPVLTISDIARRTQLSGRFIHEQAVKGNIEHYAFGGSRRKRGAIRFSERQFRQFLANQLDECAPVNGVPVTNMQAAVITRPTGTTESLLNKLLGTKQP